MDYYEEIKKANYGQNICMMMEGGSIDFDPKKRKEVVGAERMTYDEYLDVQFASLGKTRGGFASCFYNFAMGFKGRIERFTNGRVCFKAIYLEGMYPDGEMFESKEDHVWMDITGFEGFRVGDNVSFWAEVYRYVKTGNGKLIDFGLRKPEGIKRIASYELPSDEELLNQEIRLMLCDVCFYGEQCNRTFCLRDQKELRQLKKDMKRTLQADQNSEVK